MFFVLHGRVQFVYGGMEYILEAGDCVYFDASIEHHGLAYGGAPATALVVIMPTAPAGQGKAGAGDAFPETDPIVEEEKEDSKKCAS